MDLRVRLGLASQPTSLNTAIIIFEAENRIGGLLADAVVEVLTLPPEGVDPPDPRLGSAHLVSAMLRVGQRLIVVLDPERLWTGVESQILLER